MCDLNETFVFTMLDESNSYMIGTNSSENDSTNHKNGLRDRDGPIETITIPDFYNSLPVTEIGCFAFCRAKNVKHIIIGCNVRVINTFAFGDLTEVETVYIPASVEVIQYCGIHFYNTSGTVGAPSNGHVQIFMQANSNLTFLNTTFGGVRSVELYIPTAVRVQCEGNMFPGTSNITIISKDTFNFCDHKVSGIITCAHRTSSFLYHYLIAYTFVFLS